MKESYGTSSTSDGRMVTTGSVELNADGLIEISAVTVDTQNEGYRMGSSSFTVEPWHAIRLARLILNAFEESRK